MVTAARDRFNKDFTPDKYEAFLQFLNECFGEAPTFRISETPIFVSRDLKRKLFEACEQITDVITAPGFSEKANAAIFDKSLYVPNEDEQPLFLQYDFGICESETGEIVPQLIELQGFPSLYFYQHYLAVGYRKFFTVPDSYSHLFNGLDEHMYFQILRQAIVGGHDPKNVVLLEIEPEKQNTRVDFWSTRNVLGIKVLCLSKLLREGRDLYYLDEAGKRVPVYRIFNRVIFDELLKRTDLPRQFNLTEEVNAEWAGHPNWFSKISKYSMPSIHSPYVPATYFLSELRQIPDDLENYVLKPLFSFSGEGVKFNVTRADIESVENPANYILQRKVRYAWSIRTPDPADPAKFEQRMMLVWLPGEPRPMLVNNLIRMTKGDMVGVKYNKNKVWVGASVGFYEP
jgi:hypothetical protein